MLLFVHVPQPGHVVPAGPGHPRASKRRAPHAAFYESWACSRRGECPASRTPGHRRCRRHARHISDSSLPSAAALIFALLAGGKFRKPGTRVRGKIGKKSNFRVPVVSFWHVTPPLPNNRKQRHRTARAASRDDPVAGHCVSPLPSRRALLSVYRDVLLACAPVISLSFRGRQPSGSRALAHLRARRHLPLHHPRRFSRRRTTPMRRPAVLSRSGGRSDLVRSHR